MNAYYLYFLLIGLSAGMIFSGCQDDPEATTGDEVREPYSNEESDAAQDFDKDQFIAEAASDGVMEVQLAQYVQQNTNNQAVMDFAEMLQTEHAAANDKLMILAQEKNWELPDAMLPKHAEIYNRISQLTGDELDSEYLDVMIEAHNTAVAKFQNAAAFTNDDALRKWVRETMPHLERHLQSAVELKQQGPG